jgi:hypothetical protein
MNWTDIIEYALSRSLAATGAAVGVSCVVAVLCCLSQPIVTISDWIDRKIQAYWSGKPQ